ncbi:MAG: hypothetical protein KF847_18280 [Pirellulales bacterium]|nr:hypothetical protein [Pirellulales bacterium]
MKPLSRWTRLRRVCLTAALLSATPALADPLDPLAFSSLGTLNVSSGTLSINTSTLAMSGAASFTGINWPQPSGPPIAVFVFDAINITGGSISIIGDRPLALLSKSDAQIVPTTSISGVQISGSETRPGPGGYGGGYVFVATAPQHAHGAGPGGGVTIGNFAQGGAYGGAGGSSFSSPYIPGPAPYGGLLTTLQGGSGGGVYTSSGFSSGSGGGGGGAIEIGAVGNLAIGAILANGGNATSGIAGGGGAGGGILLHAGGSVSYTGTLQVNGGNPTSSAGPGSGGGAGRIAIVGHPALTLGAGVGGSFSLVGGSSGGGQFGRAGVLTVSANTTTVPAGFSAVLDGTPIVSVAGSHNQGNHTVEALIERHLTINPGGSATLAKSNVLRADSELIVDGLFHTDGHSQIVEKLGGSGQVHLGHGGELTVGATAGFATSSFAGSLVGPGRLKKIGAGLFEVDTISHTGGVDVQADTLRVTGTANPSTGIVKTGPGTLEIAGTLGAGRTHVRQGELLIPFAVVPGGDPVVIDGGAQLTVVNSTLPRVIDGASGSSVITSSGTSSLGFSGSFSGFRHQGILEVADSLTINAAGYASLGTATMLNGGATLAAPNGVALGMGSNLGGNGFVNAKIAAGLGSQIVALGGDLDLGVASSTVGFASEGELRTGAHAVTIFDANEAVLGALTALGDGSNPGTLVAGTASPGDTDLHFLVSEGRNLVGRGNVAGNVKVNGHVVGDGVAPSERIVFDAGWTVSGIGDFQNALFNGTFAPGLSPGVVAGTDLAIGGTLAIELGGSAPGNGPGHHDQVNDAGAFTIAPGASLALQAFGGYLPQIGQQFNILNSLESIIGEFASIEVDPWFLQRGIGFALQASETNLVATAVAVDGDMNGDGMVDGGDFLAWQRALGLPNGNSGDADGDGIATPIDLAIWNANYGIAAAGPTYAAVPEPAAGGLAMCAAGAALLRTRRRERTPS